jgi:hypothetical protein
MKTLIKLLGFRVQNVIEIAVEIAHLHDGMSCVIA